jgi:hypothetical protein
MTLEFCWRTLGVRRRRYADSATPRSRSVLLRERHRGDEHASAVGRTDRRTAPCDTTIPPSPIQPIARVFPGILGTLAHGGVVENGLLSATHFSWT